MKVKQICVRCEERVSIAKDFCNRCYYATKRNSHCNFEKLSQQNYKKDGNFYLGSKFIVDKDDFEKLNRYIWVHNGNGYARNAKLGYLHKVICPKLKRVDHINKNTLDNRKENLREGYYINVLNTDKRKIPCPIYQNKQGKWYGQTTVEGKKFYIPATNNRNTVVEKMSILLKSVNRLQFYKLN